MPKPTDQISHVEFFCDDKRVGEALRALIGLAIGKPDVQPVTNARKTKSKSSNGLAAASDGSILDQFTLYLSEARPEQIGSSAIKEWLKKTGRHPSNSSALAKRAVAMGLLKRIGKPKGPGHKAIFMVARDKVANAVSGH